MSRAGRGTPGRPPRCWSATSTRGGAFAHCHGTWALLPDDLRGLLAGFVLNRFRGDAALLAPGPAQLQQLTGVPLAGVVPMRRGHGLPEEDGVSDAGDGTAAGASAASRLCVAVLAPPHISNLDEFQPLARVPGLRLVWARSAAQLEGADWIVLPGSKQTSGDLAWLRALGIDAAIQRHAAAGRPVLGICGGLQMLGHTLDDPQGFDGEVVQALPGLALLPVSTVFGASKRLAAATVRFGAASGVWSALQGVVADGYEIRCGVTADHGGGAVGGDGQHGHAVPFEGQQSHAVFFDGQHNHAVLFDRQQQPIGWQSGSVLGVYAHGLFESPAVLQALFGARVPLLDDAFELLADTVDAHLDPALLARLFGQE